MPTLRTEILTPLLWVALYMLGTGCASAPSVRVASSPEGADVLVHSANRAPVKVGKTPIELDERNVPGLFSESVQLQLTKEGFSPQSVLVPKLAFGAQGRVFFNLDETALPKVCQGQSNSMNEVARGVAESASLIQRKRFDDAIRSLQSLTAKFGTVSILFDLLGNAYYLQKDLTRALEAYQRSKTLEPNNIQTARIIERIQQLQGVKPTGE